MMTCKEVSTLISRGDVASAPATRRMAVWLHLARGRHCREFRRQVEALGRVARTLSGSFEREVPQDFERTILQRLRP